jgi:hypothetical protein
MLADSTLEQFCRRSPLSEQLIRLAWPNLSVESKLQLIDALSRQHDLPSFMANIAVTETEAPIVRHWAASRLSLQFVRESQENSLSAALGIGTNSELIACKNRVANDSSELIRATASCSASTSCNGLEHSTQMERLVFIRSGQAGLFEGFVDFLERGIALGGAAQENDEELARCFDEYVASDSFQKRLNRQFVTDPYGDFCNGNALRKLWGLTHIAGPRLQMAIAFGAPVEFGINVLAASDFLTLPTCVLCLLIHDNRKPIAEALHQIRNNPEKFPADLMASIQKADEIDDDLIYSADDLVKSEARLRDLPMRDEAIFETVASLRRETHQAFAEIVGKLDAVTTRREFFG